MNVCLRFARVVPLIARGHSVVCWFVCARVWCVCCGVYVRVLYPCQSWGSRGEYLKRSKPAAAVDDDVSIPRLLPLDWRRLRVQELCEVAADGGASRR